MRNIASLALGLGLSLLCSTYATAGAPLTTPVLLATSLGSVECIVANVGTKPVDVQVDLVGPNGQNVVTCTDTVNPGEVSPNCTPVNTPGPFTGYCRFSGGNKKQIRGSIISRDSNGDPTATLAAQ